MWNLFVQVTQEVASNECAPPVPVNMGQFEKNTCESVRPFEAKSILGVRTHRGVRHGFEKPDGGYSLGNPEALAAIRQRKADEFLTLLEQTGAESGVRAKTMQKRAKVA
jgi:hypothetical protein